VYFPFPFPPSISDFLHAGYATVYNSESSFLFHSHLSH
jgi:hypothetical protein